ncbi:MAG: GNAT family N-acetyltransferase, partial [Anaerolineae bacterium]|nr:GNAT family N-acetyltransferase [Anaerolineae bacterium]
GHSKEFFLRRYPHITRPTEETCSWTYVILENGDIVSHVGLYPIETTVAGVSLNIGGIGGVSTALKARGKGYMTRLMNHIINEMRRIGYPVSWLSGDRQRYGSFGYDSASQLYQMTFTRRSLEWHKVESIAVEEVMGDEALDTVRTYFTKQVCFARRPHLERHLQRTDLRFFVTEGGYAVLAGQDRQHIHILELVSTTGNEERIIKALINWNHGESADWSLSLWDKSRLTRLSPLASYIRSGFNGMYRINDLTGLLLAAKPVMAMHASALRDFDISIGIVERDRTQVTTISVKNGELAISPGGHTAKYVELSPTSAVRLFLGGLPIPEQSLFPSGLILLLPVPAYVMPWDQV